MLIPQFICQLNSAASGAAKPVKGIDEDMRDFAPILFNEIQHPLKLLSSIGFCALISTAKVFGNYDVVAACILFNHLLLKVKRQVDICLFFRRNARVDNSLLSIRQSLASTGSFAKSCE